MPMLKVGNQYINTDLIVRVKVTTTELGKRMLSVDSDNLHTQITDRAEIDAVLYYLNNSALDIVKLHAGVVEDSQPAKRKFKAGDKALVLTEARSDHGEVITVEGYTPDGYVFHNGYCSYHEDELEPAE